MHPVVSEIRRLYAERGGLEYTIGEPITQEEHALQSAECARAAGADEALVAAALLHDIGHFLHADVVDAAEEGRDTEHEEVGAAFLARFFPREVADPVRLHVAAKRYLSATREGYAQRLSPASVLSLKLQGGPMSKAEQAAFEAEPAYRAAIALRHWDDAAKEIGAKTAPFEDFLPLLERLTIADPG